LNQIQQKSLGTSPLGASGRTGLVIRKSQGQYWVQTDSDTFICAISSKLRKHLVLSTADPSSMPRRVVSVEGIRSVDPVAIGDSVEFIPTEHGNGLIVAVQERRNSFHRRAAGAIPLEHVIVANVDQAIVVMAAAAPMPKWSLLDRYLLAADMDEIPPIICITKMDLVDQIEFRREVGVYQRIGYPLLFTSIVTEEGLRELRQVLTGLVSVLIGKSGVGKTSLLNALQPGLGERVGEVNRSTDKGRHTTSSMTLFPLDFGGYLVDTPGMREFALWEPKGIRVDRLFREFQPFLTGCRFGADCRHDREPNCAVKQAVERGEIDDRRYRSYLRLRQIPRGG
jgi:ribosome biogenesis GTPase